MSVGPAIEVVALAKAFRPRRGLERDRIVALDDVAFAVQRGECVAILGRNGAGKSTLVRILATLLLPDGGRAAIMGRDVVRESRAVAALVNRVAVEPSFFKQLSANENLAFAASTYGIRRREARARMAALLERVGFPVARADDRMVRLSRGMQQKVALARALLTRPPVLLLDEPTTGLDPRSRREVQALVAELRDEHGSAILLCTHDMAEATHLCDRVGIIDGGRLVALAPPEELMRSHDAASLEDAYLAATGLAYAVDE